MNTFPALFIPLPAKIFPNKLALNVPNNILRNPRFCSEASFLIVSVTPFNNRPESSRGLTILIMPSISSFDIISVVVPDPKIFLCIVTYAAYAAAVNPNGFKMLLAYGLITFFIKGNPVFSNGPRSLLRNFPYFVNSDD